MLDPGRDKNHHSGLYQMSVTIQFHYAFTLENIVDIFSHLVGVNFTVSFGLVAGHPKIEVFRSIGFIDQ